MFIQNHTKLVIVTLIITASLYLTVVFVTGKNDFMALFANINIVGWLSLLLCSFISYILRFSRWAYYIKQFGYDMPYFTHFMYYLSAFSLTITPGKAGETIRSLYLFNHGIPYHKSISTFFAERLLDLFVVSLLALYSLNTSNQFSVFTIIILLSVIIIFLIMRSYHIQKILVFICSSSNNKKIHKIFTSTTHFLSSFRTLFSYKALFIGFTLGLCAWLIQASAFYILLNNIGFSIPFLSAVGIYNIALLAGALSFIPGGIGSTELVMGIFLHLHGASDEIVIAAPIIIRLTSLWFAVLMGIFSSSIISQLKLVPSKN